MHLPVGFLEVPRVVAVTQIEVDAHRSIGRYVVVTLLTGKLSPDFHLVLGIADSIKCRRFD